MLVGVITLLEHTGRKKMHTILSTSGPDVITSYLAALAHLGDNTRMLDEYTTLRAARTIRSQSSFKLISLMMVGRALDRLRIVEI